MKINIAALLMIVLTASAAVAQVTTGEFKAPDGSTIVISAVEIEGFGSPKMVLRDKAHVKSFDKTGGTTMDAQADKIVVTFLTGSGGQQAINSIKSAEFTGSPKITYTTKDPQTGATVRTVATSKTATYDGVAQMAYLKGDVKVTNENPAIFQGPAVMTGDEATINLKSNIGPDEVRFRIRSNPPGVSTIEATPKPKEAAGTSK